MDSTEGSTKFKAFPNWPKAVLRWDAFWEQQSVDRPCIAVRAPIIPDIPCPEEPACMEDIWLDPEYVLQKWSYTHEHSCYNTGETVPGGPLLLAGYALGCGPDVGFARDTIWHPQILDGPDTPVNWNPGPSDPWRKKITNLVNYLLDKSPGRFMMGFCANLPLNDLLANLRGVELFLTELGEAPEQWTERLREMFPMWVEHFEYFENLIGARQQGLGYTLSWPGLWCRHMIKITQSDVSCMLSQSMFEQFVMSEIDMLGERYENICYHLDGDNAIRHLPTLISRPFIKLIQFVPMPGTPGNGPYYVDFYRDVQAAGRCLDIWVDIKNVEYLVRHLRPEGLVLRTVAPTPSAAEELLENAVKWCGSDIEKQIW
jgi:hypothetical protein